MNAILNPPSSKSNETISREYWARSKARSERTVIEMEKRLKSLSPSAHWSRWMCKTAIKAAKRDIKRSEKELNHE